MPGRLMVGRMALDHVVKVRVLPGQLFCCKITICTLSCYRKKRIMERVETSPDDYITDQEPETRAVLDELHTLIKTALPDSDYCMWEGVFWGGSEQRIIGYGNFFYVRSDKKKVEWFLVGLTRQKNYFSVYINAVEGRRYLTEIYKDRLGKVKTGKSSISFRNLEDVNVDVLREMIEHADRLTNENDT